MTGGRKGLFGALEASLRIAILCIAFGIPRIALATDADTFSPVVSYQYQDSLDEPGSQPPVSSPVVSYQYYDWVGDANVIFQNSPNVSYYYNGAPSIVTQPITQMAPVGGAVTFSVQANGSTPLSYQWYFNNAAIIGATGASLGFNSAQLTQAGSYTVKVGNAYGYVMSNAVFLNVYLDPLTPKPTPPVFTTAGSTPPFILTAPQSAKGSLVYLNGSIDNTKRTTIVLTHGWMSNSGDWPTVMANALKANGYSDVNIVAWDWRENANPNFATSTSSAFVVSASLARATSLTYSEGRALGAALVTAFGPNSNMQVHFMGHSLGTLVNCAAADYLHGDLNGSPANSSKNPPVQMTLFDEAELAQALHGIYVFADILLKPQGAAEPSGSLSWKVIPSHYQWVDNYVSLVGLLHPEAANVKLWREINLDPATAHGYAYQWYEATVTKPSNLPVSYMGHFWSFENDSLNTTSLPSAGSLFKQSSASNIDQYTITEDDPSIEATFRQHGQSVVAYPETLAYLGLSAIENSISAPFTNAIQYTGNVAGSIIQAFRPINGEPVYIGTSDSTPAYFGTPPQPPPIFQANWDLQVTMQGQGGNATGNSVKSNGRGSKHPPRFIASDDPSPGPVSIVMPVTVPVTAVGVTFDYQFQNAGPDDFMNMGLGSDNYFTMEAANTTDGAWNTTPVIDVSSYAGQQIQFTFVLSNASSGTPAGTLQVRGIQFFSPPMPQLSISTTDAQAVLSWPISAVDWTLESTTDLKLTNGWQPASDLPVDTDYFHTMTFDISTEKKAFFRLRKSPAAP